MLYGEFLNGTGCKDNKHNYEVYEKVEIIYNYSPGMTHEQAYEIGKLLVDNSLTEKEKAKLEELKERKQNIKNEIKGLKEMMEYHKRQMEIYKKDLLVKKDELKFTNEWINELKN